MTLERSPLLFEAEPARRLPRQPDPERGRAAAGAARSVAPNIASRRPTGKTTIVHQQFPKYVDVDPNETQVAMPPHQSGRRYKTSFSDTGALRSFLGGRGSSKQAAPARHPKARSITKAKTPEEKAQAMANALGRTTDYDEPDKGSGRYSRQPAKMHVVRKPDGSIYHTAKRPTDPGHKVLHTAISEGFVRSPLILESVPVRYASDEMVRKAFEPSARKTTVSDENLRARLAGATGAHAARLKSLLKQREMLKRGVSRKDTPESGARTITTDAQRAARDTVQRRYRGARTQEMRPPGHKTQELASSSGGDTRVLPTPPVQPLSTKRRRPEKTQRPPRIRTASVDILGPLLQEFAVTTTSAWKSGIAPDETIAGGKAAKGAQTTANIGHTTQQGAAVPDKKKRETKIPKSKLPQGVRDPVTKELEKQPAFPAGPMLSRSGLLGV